jgi:N-acetylmuramoyl-L-alanine amidase
MKIGIDPGHGGHDPGAIGPTGLYEKDVALSVAKRLDAFLVAAGQEVIMTRQDDSYLSLFARSNLLNAQGVDMVISVHCNSSTDRTANYVVTYIQGMGGKAEQVAKRVQARLVGATGWADGGVRVGNLHMTRETTAPAIIAEMGFISNPEQESQLRSMSWRDKLAKAIANGIEDYLGVTRDRELVVKVKGQDIAGKLIDGVTWVPLRQIVDLLNEDVMWSGPDQPVIVE